MRITVMIKHKFEPVPLPSTFFMTLFSLKKIINFYLFILLNINN